MATRLCYGGMCLLFMYVGSPKEVDGYKLILANNRDEFLYRPTGTADFRGDHPQWIGGIDLEKGREGGTWLGLSTNGKIACLLNILAVQKPDLKGRGFLVPDFVTGGSSCEGFLQKVSQEVAEYNAFHLVLLDLNEPNCKVHALCSKEHRGNYCKNENFYSCDNRKSVGRPWRKSVVGQKRFEDIVHQYGTRAKKDDLIKELVELLSDDSPNLPDENLAEQFSDCGRDTSGDYIARQSAINVVVPWKKYGTRTNTLILVDHTGSCEYIERTLSTPVNFDSPEWTTLTKTFCLDLPG